jgi:hypothetical protein
MSTTSALALNNPVEHHLAFTSRASPGGNRAMGGLDTPETFASFQTVFIVVPPVVLVTSSGAGKLAGEKVI